MARGLELSPRCSDGPAGSAPPPLGLLTPRHPSGLSNLLCPPLVLPFPSQVGKGPAAPHFPGQLHPAPPLGPTPQSPDNSVSGWCLNIPPHPTPPLSLPRKLQTSPQFPASEAADELLERWVLTAPAPNFTFEHWELHPPHYPSICYSGVCNCFRQMEASSQTVLPHRPRWAGSWV